jgi:glycosyltransferase involved in cell wall biosynthesis
MSITNVCAVMPTFNQELMLIEAILSVVDQVDHLVIVNDGSTDGTRELLDQRNDVSVIHCSPNGGTAKAINAGVDYLRANYTFDWLTWVSSDNVCYPHWIQTELDAAAANERPVGAVYSAMDVVELPGVRRTRGNHRSFMAYDRKALHTRPAAYFGCSFIIREDVWPAHRGRMAHDYDHWMRVEEQCWVKGLDIIGLDQALATYQVHPGQATLRGRGSDKDARKWWREGLERRKLMGIEP